MNDEGDPELQDPAFIIRLTAEKTWGLILRSQINHLSRHREFQRPRYRRRIQGKSDDTGLGRREANDRGCANILD